jgi:CRP-like cAMP-binding protein
VTAWSRNARGGQGRDAQQALAMPATLRHCHDLQDDDIKALETVRARQRRVGARQDIVRDGDRLNGVLLVIEGWTFRYKLLNDGAKAIVGFLLPGDLCDGRSWLVGAMDHGIASLTPATILEISVEQWAELVATRPRVAEVLQRATAVHESIAYEWLLNVGQRTAYPRIAHLICELWERLAQRGLTYGNSADFPLTQHDIGDTLGLTTVHVNRVLQLLRADGLIALDHRRLTILDKERLHWVGDFTPTYLHMLPRSVHVDA